MHFDQDWSEKDESFTVSLYKTKRSKSKWVKIGQSRSFFLLHLKNQKLKDVNLEFKDNYDSKWEGKIIMRMQYIKDELSLYSQILEDNIKRSELLIKWIDILTLQIQAHRERRDKSFEFKSYEDLNLEWGSFNAAYYSEYWNDSVAEWSSYSHKDQFLIDEYK